MKKCDDLPNMPITKKTESMLEYNVIQLKNYITSIPDDQFNIINKLFYLHCNVVICSLQRYTTKQLRLSLKHTPGLDRLKVLILANEISSTISDLLQFFFDNFTLIQFASKLIKQL